MDERVLCERLITYDTSTAEGIQSAAGFVKGWLEARDIEVDTALNNGLPVLAATVGADKGPTIVLHGHLDVVPAEAHQFEPYIDGDRLVGRGAYDMAIAVLLVPIVAVAAALVRGADVPGSLLVTVGALLLGTAIIWFASGQRLRRD